MQYPLVLVGLALTSSGCGSTNAATAPDASTDDGSDRALDPDGSQGGGCDPATAPVCASECEDDFSTVPKCDMGTWSCEAYPSTYQCQGDAPPCPGGGVATCDCTDGLGPVSWQCGPEYPARDAAADVEVDAPGDVGDAAEAAADASTD